MSPGGFGYMDIIDDSQKKTITLNNFKYFYISHFIVTPLLIKFGSQLSTLGAFHRMSAGAYTGSTGALMPFCGKVRAFNVVRGEQ